MNRISSFRAAMVVLVPMMAIALGGAALAQSPAPSVSPAASPAASPTPAAPVAPVPPPAETKSPADPPATAQSPSPPPPAANVQTADPFGEEFTLAPKKVVIMKGTANWDAAFDTLIESFKALTVLLESRASRHRAIR